MKTEAEVRGLHDWYVEDKEGGIDPFNTESSAPQEHMCLWCVRLRVLKWVLGELDEADNGTGMAKYGWTLCK